MIHLLYREKFEPIVRIGEHVGIIDGKNVLGIYKVKYVEPLQPVIYNLGPLQPASANGPYAGQTFDLDAFEPPENELYQIRIRLLDDFALIVRQPASTTRFNLRTESTLITLLSPEHFCELFTWKDRKPQLQPLNYRFTTLKLARIMVYGFRYVLEKVAKDLAEAQRKGVKEVTWVIVGALAPTASS